MFWNFWTIENLNRETKCLVHQKNASESFGISIEYLMEQIEPLFEEKQNRFSRFSKTNGTFFEFRSIRILTEGKKFFKGHTLIQVEGVRLRPRLKK